MPRKKIPQHEQLDKKKQDIEQRILDALPNPLTEPAPMAESYPATPEAVTGDIIQIAVKGHKFVARIGIVHHVEDTVLICYNPVKGGVPVKFKVDARDVMVVGKAHLKYNKPLPDDDVAKTNLDQI